MDGIHFWGDEWNGKSVLEARSLFENGMIQAEIQRKRESDFQYSNREIANNEPPTLLREKRSGAGGFFIYVVLCQDFVQIKMRQFSVFNLPGAQLACAFFHPLVRTHRMHYPMEILSLNIGNI